MENNIIQPLAHLLANAEFDIRKEAAWAISNATSGGTPEQIKYLVSAGCIKPLCDLLICADARIITVALEGLENILKVPPPPWLACAGAGVEPEMRPCCFLRKAPLSVCTGSSQDVPGLARTKV